MKKADLSIFDYRKGKEEKNYSYVIDEKANGKFEKYSVRTKEAGYVDCYIYRPSNSANKLTPAIVNLHGGGFVLGYCEQDGIYCRQLADKCQCSVINVDYCLAPEFKFPKSIYSTYHVISELKKHALDLGLDPDNFSIIGHSAGGSIACGVALLDQDKHELSLKKMVLNYALLDMKSLVEIKRNNEVNSANKRLIDYINWYLQSDNDASNPLASPLYGNLSKLPETFILGAQLDPLLSKEIEFYDAAKKAGSTVSFKEYQGCRHGFTHKWFDEFNPKKSQEA